MIKNILTIFIATVFVACGVRTNITVDEYRQETSNDSTFVVDVPKSTSRYLCINSSMSFLDEKDHLIISIEKSNMSPKAFDSTQKLNSSFSRTIIEDSDSILIAKSTRGAMNVWAAYTCTGKKEINGTGYIVSLTCDTWSLESCRDVLVHMMNSIKEKE